MALLKFGGGITEMRGSIGGTVFSRNRSGAIARQRTTPVNPQSTRQNAARAVMALVSANWFNALSAANRAAWNLFADNVPSTNKLGEVINLSGFNQFCKSNAAAINAGLAAIAGGPTTFVLPGEDATFAVAASEATQLLTLTFDDTRTWCGEDGGALIVQMGIPQGASISYFNGPWRAAGVVEGDSGTPVSTGETVTAPFYITEDEQLFVRARVLRADGSLSDWFRVSISCAA